MLLCSSFCLWSSQKGLVTNHVLGCTFVASKQSLKCKCCWLCSGFRISSKHKHDLTVFLLQLGPTQGFAVFICVGMCWVLGRLSFLRMVSICSILHEEGLSPELGHVSPELGRVSPELGRVDPGGFCAHDSRSQEERRGSAITLLQPEGTDFSNSNEHTREPERHR